MKLNLLLSGGVVKALKFLCVCVLLFDSFLLLLFSFHIRDLKAENTELRQQVKDITNDYLRENEGPLEAKHVLGNR